MYKRQALAANITNEGGAEGRYRVLKNIMGLWLLQRVLQERQINDLQALIAATQALPACRFIINPAIVITNHATKFINLIMCVDITQLETFPQRVNPSLSLIHISRTPWKVRWKTLFVMLCVIPIRRLKWALR